MKNKSDLKILSLQLYGKEVEITLRENSTTYKFYNTSVLKGILAGRIWGNTEIVNERPEDTVIALMLKQDDKEIEIPCEDIELLKNRK